MSRWGSSTGNGAGWLTRRALSASISHTSKVAARNSSAVVLVLWGSPSAARRFGVRARSNRPFDAMITRSVTSRNTGLAADRYDPQATEPTAPFAFLQITSPRSSSRRSSWRIRMTSADRLR